MVFKNYLIKLWNSFDFFNLLALSPAFVLLSIIGLFHAYKDRPYGMDELTKIDGEFSEFNNNNGKVVINGKEIRLNFDCLCNYGWGYKSFSPTARVFALAKRGYDDSFEAWSLTIGDQEIYKYSKYYAQRLKSSTEFRHIFYSFSVFSILLSILFLIRIAPMFKQWQKLRIVDVLKEGHKESRRRRREWLIENKSKAELRIVLMTLILSLVLAILLSINWLLN